MHFNAHFGAAGPRDWGSMDKGLSDKDRRFNGRRFEPTEGFQHLKLSMMDPKTLDSGWRLTPRKVWKTDNITPENQYQCFFPKGVESRGWHIRKSHENLMYAFRSFDLHHHHF